MKTHKIYKVVVRFACEDTPNYDYVTLYKRGKIPVVAISDALYEVNHLTGILADNLDVVSLELMFESNDESELIKEYLQFSHELKN